MSCLFLICYCINFLQKVPLQNLSFSFYSEISKSTYSDDHYIRRCMCVVLGCSILILPTISSSSIPLWSLTPFPVYLVWFASQWGYVVITTPNGVLDHEEAIKQNVGGQVLGYFHWQGELLSSTEWGGNALCPYGIITLLLGLNPFCFGFWEHVCFPSWSSRNAITCQKY